jgi:hypothetical protein
LDYSEVNYPTIPNNIERTTYYANVEKAEGICNGTSNNFSEED